MIYDVVVPWTLPLKISVSAPPIKGNAHKGWEPKLERDNVAHPLSAVLCNCRCKHRTNKNTTTTTKNKNSKVSAKKVLTGIKKMAISKPMKAALKQTLTSGGGAFAGGLMATMPQLAPFAPAAQTIGSALGARLSRFIGSGDYISAETPVVNSLIRSSASPQNSFGDKGINLKHREFITDISNGTSGVFTVRSFRVNPGISTTFPFLAQIARNFEEFKFKGLIFEFISSTSPYFNNGAMGTNIMAMDYNPSNANFVSKIAMENSDFAISARPDVGMCYGIECEQFAQNCYFILQPNSGSLPVTSTDIGEFQFATQSPLPTAAVLGELWVTYDVEMSKPRLVGDTGLAYAKIKIDDPTTTNMNGSTNAISSYGYTNVVCAIGGSAPIQVGGLLVGETFTIEIIYISSPCIGQLVLSGLVGFTENQTWPTASTQDAAASARNFNATLQSNCQYNSTCIATATDIQFTVGGITLTSTSNAVIKIVRLSTIMITPPL